MKNEKAPSRYSFEDRERLIDVMSTDVIYGVGYKFLLVKIELTLH